MFQQYDASGGPLYGQKIDIVNRSWVLATTLCDCKDNSQRLGESYEFATGAFVTLADDTNEHAILYLKNTSTTKALMIHELRTCGTATLKWILYKNDTGGTLISDANAGVEVNHNFSSANVAAADVWAASASGKTRSGGSWMSQHIDELGHSEMHFAGALILGANNSLTLTATLEAAAAGVECCCRIHGYYETL